MRTQGAATWERMNAKRISASVIGPPTAIRTDQTPIGVNLRPSGGRAQSLDTIRSPDRSSASACRESSSIGEHRPSSETLRERRLASHSEFAIDETDSTKQKSVPPPIAIAPIRCHVRCCALPAEAEYAVLADPGGSPWRHNRGRPTCKQADGADARVPTCQYRRGATPCLKGAHLGSRACRRW